MKILKFFLILLFLYSCQKKEIEKPIPEKLIISVPKKEIENINYFEFEPELIKENHFLKDFEMVEGFKVGDNKIFTGIFSNEKIDFSTDKKLDDYGGKRLVALNMQNKMVYKSKGAGDLYLFQPHFYKNNSNGKILIVCQLAFEYFCGGEAFLLEKDKISYLGNLNIESNDMEIKLIDILKINENNNQITFSFKRDSLIMDPGGKDENLVSRSAKYIYNNGKLKFEK